MKELLLFLSYVLWGSADALHTDIHVVGCSYIHGGVMFGLNREELWYADFEKQMDVYPQPPFVQPISFGDGAYKIAVANLYGCRQFLQLSETAMKDFPPQRDAPSGVTIYTRNEVELRAKNTLVCHVTGFYPAPVKVSWTKNGQITTGGSSINNPYPTKWNLHPDRQTAVHPKQGDVYSCTVEHLDVDTPETPEKHKPSLGPAVFCGTFFILKANKCI
uniref:Ig-like domain-containing protein n=1 Tax=Maylandia zebra TaxID=106582 RepID=A0A3P9D2Z6_9CICH